MKRILTFCSLALTATSLAINVQETNVLDGLSIRFVSDETYSSVECSVCEEPFILTNVVCHVYFEEIDFDNFEQPKTRVSVVEVYDMTNGLAKASNVITLRRDMLDKWRLVCFRIANDQFRSSSTHSYVLSDLVENYARISSKIDIQPDLCVVLVDSLRPDHLGCYGYERDTSPAVDAFAEGAVRFDQAIASGSWTQPSIMSMMASVPADVHQRVHWGRPHSTNVVTLAETLQKAGYQTVGLVANPMTNRKYGFARGFDFYDDYSLTGAPDATTGDIARQTAQGAKLTRIAQDWIERRRDPEKPLFLFVLYIDVHWDYLPPPPFNRMFAPDPVPPPRDIWNLGRASVPEAARRRSVAAYDGEMRYTDGCISNLLAAIDASPRGKDTVVVFCSDHGESFWERGVASHGNALFDEELRVPLVIRPARGDGEPAPPRVVSEQVGLIDLAPTLADLAGVPAPMNWVGRSLAPALCGETLPEVPIVLDNRIGDDGAILRGVRTSRWKVVAGPPHDRPDELYDLRADPAETNNLLRAGGFALPPEVEALVPLLKPVR